MKLCGLAAAAGMFLLVAGLGQTTAPTTSAPATPLDPKAKLLNDFLSHPIHFDAVCFRGETFPACDFDKPEDVRALIGPYTLKVTFYDAKGQITDRAGTPGRYAAVVEIVYGARTTHRFVTLCRLSGPPADPSAAATQPSELLHDGIDADILKEHAAELPQRRAYSWSLYRPWQSIDAILTAGLFDLTAMKNAGAALPKDSLVALDRQWWVNFKRRYYGYDQLYTKPFVCPQKFEGPPATTVHDGTLAQAGMAPDAVARIDDECNAWVKESGEGFSLCVVRHGVIVIHKAYGNRTRRAFAGKPYEVDTFSSLDSTTKFLSGMLVSEFAAQGLINIDDPVGKYVAPLRDLANPNPPTIRNLYLHNAGFDGHWGDYLNDLEEEIADLYPVVHADSVHRYQGVGHALGGKIMETISGESVGRLFQKHLFEPLGCTHMQCDTTSFGASGTSRDLAIMGQMMLNGGAYGNLRFTSPKIIEQMQPIPGRDRFDPDKTIRWGVGIKMFDSDNFSPKGFGGSGACGAFLKLDPTYDVVISMVRDTEGAKYHQHRGALVRVILNSIQDNK